MADEFLNLVQSRNFTVKVRLDTAGRKGKTVTLLEGLPKQELFLNGMTKTLKSACGSGGTYSLDHKDGVIELQGDHRDRVCKYFEKHGIKFRRA